MQEYIQFTMVLGNLSTFKNMSNKLPSYRIISLHKVNLYSIISLIIGFSMVIVEEHLTKKDIVSYSSPSNKGSLNFIDNFRDGSFNSISWEYW